MKDIYANINTADDQKRREKTYGRGDGAAGA